MNSMSRTKADRSPSAAKRWSFRLLAVTLSVLLCFLCLETTLSVWGPKYYRFGETRTLGVEVLDAEGNRAIGRIRRLNEFHSNPRGYFDISRTRGETVVYGLEMHEMHATGSPHRRIPENIENTQDVLAFITREDTVLALGDSFTLGQGVRYEDTYVRRLEKLLAKEGKPIRIKNTGVAGYEIEHICTAYDLYSAESHYPLVIYGFVLNDFGMPGKESVIGSDFIDLNNGGCQYNPWRTHYASVNFVYSRIERIRLDRTTRQSYLEAFKGKNADDKFELLRTMNRKTELNDSRLVIVLFPLLHEFHDYPFQEIHDKVCDFCRKDDILLLDLLPAFSEHKAESLWVHPTDYHPNEIAHRIAAKQIHVFLKHHRLLETLVVEEP